ncbi:GtrA family protein [Thiohalocapsa marina]|uniref:GtrA family protein n=1 Tax=Thiohalocapsa marina TaxID=424902 RepID=A0A5M8FVL9_9GAMM|nr:GtrA family protein [Thiohalocapsa marina]KAA6187860.1 GtrA family protein [Thiohalocapsa marina]
MSNWRLQGLRFGIVGLTSNFVLYLLYLLVVWLGTDPKLAVTLLYILGLSMTFIFNKRWSFSHRGNWRGAAVRYFSLYGILYSSNILVLMFLVDHLYYPHALVQAGVVLVFIPVVFLTQRYWVFAKDPIVPS